MFAAAEATKTTQHKAQLNTSEQASHRSLGGHHHLWGDQFGTRRADGANDCFLNGQWRRYPLCCFVTPGEHPESRVQQRAF